MTWNILTGSSMLLGLALAAGTFLILDAVYFSRTRRLGDRIASQLGPTPGLDSRSRYRKLAVLWPMHRDRRAQLETRLREAGRNPDPLRHRSITLLCCVSVAAICIVSFLIAGQAGTLRPGTAVLVLVASIAATIVWRTTSLTRAQTRKKQRMAAQLPLLADLLALAVGAGEAVGPALHRASRELGGELGERVQAALARSATGVPLTKVLRELESNIKIPALSECFESIIVAGERGSPLASVLRDQASDAREAARRDLLEAGGKAETRMLAPVVFGLLPLTVLFAIFPSIDLISLSV